MNTLRSTAKALVALVATLSMTACVASSEPTDADGEDLTGEAVQADSTGVHQVCLTAHSHDNSGTGNSITIGYYENVVLGTLSTCVLPNGVGTGATACCTPTSVTSTPQKIVATLSYMGFVAYYTNTSSDGDGLRITNMSASVTTTSTQTMSAGTYTDILFPDKIACEGCAAGTFCNSCWLDGDGHDNRTGMQISIDGYDQIGSNAVYPYSS